MESEILFVALIVAPWALALLALLFYRRRRIRKSRDSAGKE